jgi:pantoate--beta-alanine ligase
VYLTPEERRRATVLHEALDAMRRRIDAGERNVGTLLELSRGMIVATPGAVLDYATIVDFDTLRPLDRLRGKVLIALAVYFGTTRLIDNVLIDVN